MNQNVTKNLRPTSYNPTITGFIENLTFGELLGAACLGLILLTVWLLA